MFLFFSGFSDVTVINNYATI